MQLKTLTYSEYSGEPQEWVLEPLVLGDRNLLVGKNATGKSRTLNVINGLAQYVSGITPPKSSGKFTAEFINKNITIKYNLEYKKNEVTFEEYIYDDQTLLIRGEGGAGHIWAADLDGGKMIRFQTPPDQFAVVARRDNIQHPFLEPLYTWGSSVHHYLFGSPLGKDRFIVFSNQENKKIDERDPNAVIALYDHAKKKFGSSFEQLILQDMKTLNYDITAIDIGFPTSIQLNSSFGPAQCLIVKEVDLPGFTDQHSMSQGMFRALSILIHVNYSQMSKLSTCIIVDDIGEGLDFERSCQLVDILREKSVSSQIQLILSTNDRFVMNRVPLEEWTVLQRKGNHVYVKNHLNAKVLFDDFKFTGLSNFSFLEMDFAGEGLGEYAH